MNFKGLLGKLLPTLGAALPLPPPLGNMAATYIGKAIGVPDLKPEDAEKAVEAAQAQDPEILLKLKQADAEFAAQMKAMDVNLEQIYAEDRASARAMQVSVKSHVPAILALTVTVGFFVALGFALFHEIPKESQQLVYTMITTLGVLVVQVFNYNFGSTSQSARKTELIAKAEPVTDA
jgi:hypothetical protein